MQVHIFASLCVFALAAMNPAGQTLAAQPGQFTMTATDYGFMGPEQVPSGLTAIEVVNQGAEVHHAQLVRLAAGKTPADFAAAMKADPEHPRTWMTFVGGPNAVVPGDRATALMDLQPGQHLVLCLVPNKAGVAHVALGMAKPFMVTERVGTSIAVPKPDVVITARDFQFELSKPITAGSHTIQLVNEGGQAHEVVLVKLAPDAKAKDFIAAFEPGAVGPAPGRPLGGIVGIERGSRGLFTAMFDPGSYALICFFPDKQTGAPHFAQGMTREFVVR
ncbi:MAG: hypothetical protein QM771_10525 [Nitrospira sp.]